MANLIDATYFEGEIEIPNTNQPEVETDLNNSIVRWEREVLIQLLGYTLYTELMAAVALPYIAGDKWDKLINGEDFTFELNGQTVTTKWEGLLGFEKKSLIAYYVYFMHRRRRATYTAVGNEVQSKTDNSEKVSAYHKMVEVWNEFIAMYGNVCSVGASQNSYYHEDVLPSAYNYLLAKKTDFPNWIYTDMGGRLNKMGI